MLLVQRQTSRTSIFRLASFRERAPQRVFVLVKIGHLLVKKITIASPQKFAVTCGFFSVCWQVSLDVASAMAHSQDFNFFMAGFRENRIKMGKYECTVTC
jgi:hypothetical protein